MTDPHDATALFEEHRAGLVGAAYRILGTRSDAEDVVQETWIRWSRADHEQVGEPRAYLLTIATRLALNRWRQLERRKETYVGPWLPEPVSSSPGLDPAAAERTARTDPAQASVTADEVSMALLIVLESLSPLERAAFVLVEAFGLSAPEAAEALDRSPAAVRQLVHRARSHVQARRPRTAVDAQQHRAVVERFLAAAAGGDMATLMDLLSPDVVLVTDGGGVKQAALRPIHGADKTLRWFVGVMSRPSTTGFAFALREINGEAAVLVTDGGAVDGVVFLTVEDGQVTAVHGIRNPDKLRAVTA